jgi:hypothetical protein
MRTSGINGPPDESEAGLLWQFLTLTGVRIAGKRLSNQHSVTHIDGDEDRTMAQNEIRGQTDPGQLAAMITRAAGDTNNKQGLPPVERWNPPFCGDLDMEIRADGTWFYMGTPIGRQPLVRLFSTVLRKDDDGKTYLVTPVEKVGIRVQDAHFVAVEMAVSGEGDERILTFRTNVGDVVEAGPEHPLRFQIHGENNELKPYLHVRGNLEALVSRPVMYDLVELGEHVDVEGVSMFCLRSGGMVFAVMRSEELDALSQ